MTTMIDDALIEAVARAICRAWYYCDLDKPDGINHWLVNKARCTAEAKAALTALTSEGIHVWGPDGERFERMFGIIMAERTLAPPTPAE